MNSEEETKEVIAPISYDKNVESTSQDLSTPDRESRDTKFDKQDLQRDQKDPDFRKWEISQAHGAKPQNLPDLRTKSPEDPPTTEK